MKICIRTYTYVCILWIVPHFPPSCQSFKLIVSIDLSHWLIHTPIGRLAICNFTFVRVAASWVLSNLQHTYIYTYIFTNVPHLVLFEHTWRVGRRNQSWTCFHLDFGWALIGRSKLSPQKKTWIFNVKGADESKRLKLNMLFTVQLCQF